MHGMYVKIIVSFHTIDSQKQGASGLGTTLQAGMAQVRVSMVLLDFFIDVILGATLWPWG